MNCNSSKLSRRARFRQTSYTALFIVSVLFGSQCYGQSPGDLDPRFNAAADSFVWAVALQADGRILVGGGFLTLKGERRNYLGRLLAEGALHDRLNRERD